MCDLVCDEVMCTSLFVFGLRNVLTCESVEVLSYERILLTVLAHSRTGHILPVLTLCCVIVSIFSPFFWVRNVMETQSAEWRSASGLDLSISKIAPWSPTVKNLMSAQRKVRVRRLPSPLFVVVYSHERMAKNKAPQRREPIASVSGVVLSSWILCHTESGRHAWFFEAGSSSLYDLICLVMRALFVPFASLVGSGRRFCRKA